ncbi:MAG: beta-ketoacyl-ACP synthase III [Fibrobacterota bacterium]
MTQKIFSRIAGMGMSVPENVVTNHDLEKIVDTNDEWIRTRTGMSERHIVKEEDRSSCMTSDLGLHASEEAIKKAGIDKNEIDLIICATFSPDYIFPSTACVIQHKLDLNEKCAAFDVQAACAGFIHGLSIADNFIKSGMYKTVLLVGAEVVSKTLDWTDRDTCVLFGDGAGAALLRASDESGVMSTNLGADGSFGSSLYLPVWDKPFMKMTGSDIYKKAVRCMSEALLKAAADAEVEPSDIDLIVPHQANIRIMQAVAKRLGAPWEKVMCNIHKYGNTSSATIPIALYEAEKEGKIKSGSLVGLTAFGGGLAWGAGIIKW